MLLQSTNGKSFELTIMNYQYPGVVDDRYDANWLFIKGQLKGTDRDWFFTEPCMETHETKNLCDWLQEVINRTAQPKLEFTEPYLSFAVLEYDYTTVKLQMEYKTWDRSKHDYERYPVVLEVTIDNLQNAINQWQKEMQRFPVR